jgi:TolB-like protein
MSAIRFNLMGEFQCLASDGHPLDFTLAKDQGILAILALSEGYSCSRSRIIDLLWSSRSEEQARTSLRQSLYSLKKTVGISADGVLQIDRKRIGLNADMIESDVGEFLELIDSTDSKTLEKALALYRGDLLEGLVIRDIEWDEWLSLERESLRSKLADILSRLIERRIVGPNFEKLIEVGRRLVELDPFREEGHRALMRGYAESNQRTQALQQFERCRELLQRELNIGPAPETQNLFMQVKQGEPVGVQSDARVFSGTSIKQTSPEAASTVDQLPRTAPLTDKPSILVMPFVNASNDQEQEYLARGITDNIIIALTPFRELFVFAYKTSMATNGVIEAPVDAYEKLGARYVVEGSVLRAKDRIRVTARLVDAQEGRHLWAQNYDRNPTDLLAVQDDITEYIVTSLVGVVEETDRLRALHIPQEQLLPYDFVLRGRVWSKEYTRKGTLKARECFQKAIDLDPNYAPAYGGMAVSYSREWDAFWCEQPDQVHAKMLEYANKALDLDNTNISGRFALACAYYFGGEYERSALEIEQAIIINPNDYHNLCAKAWFLTYSGHLQEGLQCSAKAMRVNPFAADGCLETIGIGEYLSGNYNQALLAYSKCKSNSLFKLGGMAACYAHLGRMEEATRYSQEFIAIAETDPQHENWHAYWNRTYKFKNLRHSEHLLDGMKKAGIPVSINT